MTLLYNFHMIQILEEDLINTRSNHEFQTMYIHDILNTESQMLPSIPLL